jgi:hypothetical protein
MSGGSGMRCPLCALRAGRAEIHAHLADEHAQAVQTWIEPDSGRMRYRIACPDCGSAHEARIKPRSHDPQFLERFSREIRLVAFDMLLSHIEAEHQPLPEEERQAPARPSLPAASAAGGRGRPGSGGIPLPPGMGEVELPAWMRAAEAKRQGKATTEE